MQKLIIAISSLNYDVDSRQKTIYPVLYTSVADLQVEIDKHLSARLENLQKAQNLWNESFGPVNERFLQLIEDDITSGPEYDDVADQQQALFNEHARLLYSYININGTNINLNDIMYDYRQNPQAFHVYTLDEWFDVTLKDFEKLPSID